MPDGIKSKKFFKEYIDVPKIYLQSHETSEPSEQINVFKALIIQQSCAENHKDFLTNVTTLFAKILTSLSSCLSKGMRI